jgi:hypothetical protein
MAGEFCELVLVLVAREGGHVVNDWWETFFDQDYLRIGGQVFTVEVNKKQAEELWSLLDL